MDSVSERNLGITLAETNKLRLRLLLQSVLSFLDKLAGFVFASGLVLILLNNPQTSKWLTPDTGLSFILFTVPYLLIRLSSKPIRFEPLIHIPMVIIFLFSGLAMGLPYIFSFLNSASLVSIDKSFYSPIVFVFICISVYVIVKANNKILEIPFALMTVATTAGIIWSAFTTHYKGIGFISPMNYDIAPILIIGCLISPHKWRYWVAGVSVVGLFFTGAEIGLLCVILLGMVVLLRRDFSRKILLPVTALALCFAVSIPTGVFHDLWIHNGLQITLGDRIDALAVWHNGGSFQELDYLLTGNRLAGEWANIRQVTLFGHGYDTGINPANQFLIMTDQIGIIGALAWVAATLTWGIKTKGYYLLPTILVIGLLDVFFWRAGLLWWWALLGIANQGLIFKNNPAHSQ